ncbi:hypothetical protein RT717_12950 [Imperialibacter roseus]|uniref:Uncharacterized protein n=1 Tax=Imperialibacter roseus TaxID=1324217 RepID=A0ABZ0J0S5_9BACT|nr:hypothetical protein [Imperialibacter roseus]WOK09547.1 hypothetical protein RT717_12950 [Imperialibacter roseus]
MPSIVWNREPQEAMDNPYEYGAQEQFQKEAERLTKELLVVLGERNGEFSLEETTSRKAVWMLFVDALVTCIDIVECLSVKRHRLVGKLLRDLDESIDLAFLFNTNSSAGDKLLTKWYNDEIIPHREYRKFIKSEIDDDLSKVLSELYSMMSKHAHGTYKVLLYSYILRGKKMLVHDSKYESGILVHPKTIAMYYTLVAHYLKKLVNGLRTSGLIEENIINSIWKSSLDEATVPRRFEIKKKKGLDN